jgi:outer membrane translocation and assembly module TamA
MFNETGDPANPKWIAYPTLAYTPETRWEIGVSALYVYYAQRDTLNRLSEISTFSFFTQERQYGLWLDHALYSHQSKWFFLGRLRWQRFPLLYYGIGPDSPSSPLARVDANMLLLRERLLRRAWKSLYLGLEFDYQRLGQVQFNILDEALTDLPTGANGSESLGLGVGVVYDDRHNVLNVREGFFGEFGLLRYSPDWGSKTTFTTTVLDLRFFHTVVKNQVLAFQLYGQHIEGDPPFNQLGLMGGESLMRGYYLGRYRDRNLLAGQVEYRFLPFPFSRRWGAAAFLSAGQVAPDLDALRLNRWAVAGGAGLRFLIFPAKDIFTRFDVAFTREGTGFYFYIGEAF